MNDILITIGIALLFLSTIWIYERRLTSLEDLLVLQFTEPEFDTHARQAMAVANAAKAEANDISGAELDELLAPYSMKPTDTIIDDYAVQPGDRMLRLLDSMHEDEEPRVVSSYDWPKVTDREPAEFSQDEIDRYN